MTQSQGFVADATNRSPMALSLHQNTSILTVKVQIQGRYRRDKHTRRDYRTHLG